MDYVHTFSPSLRFESIRMMVAAAAAEGDVPEMIVGALSAL